MSLKPAASDKIFKKNQSSVIFMQRTADCGNQYLFQSFQLHPLVPQGCILFVPFLA